MIFILYVFIIKQSDKIYGVGDMKTLDRETIKKMLHAQINVNGHIMDQNGEYTYLADNRTGPAVNAQETFQQLADRAASEHKKS